jgi:ribosomal protein S18 acetylase RimI-like enzyme
LESSRLAADAALRPVGPGDDELLLRVYASTRELELAAVAWSDEQRDAFLRQQCSAQATHWRQARPDARWDVIEVDGHAAGRLYVDRAPDEIRIVDIALLPEFRGAGIGTALLREILAEADERGVSVTLHVERANRARHLYERLGFLCTATSDVYDLYERRPATQAR